MTTFWECTPRKLPPDLEQSANQNMERLAKKLGI
jgi:hypothetical protein